MSKLALKLIKENKESKATYLDLSDCDLKELPKEIEALTWLKVLFLNENIQLSNLTPLSALSNLQVLEVVKTQVNNLGPLSTLSQLQILHISETHVNDLSPISTLFQLQMLYASKTKINDLRALISLSKLQRLDIRNTKVSDLSPLSALSKLQELYASNTLISNLNPLSVLPQMEVLDVSSTQVSDLSPLKIFIEKSIRIRWQSYGNENRIHFMNCPLTNPPKEIVKQGNEAILNYFKQIEAQGGTETINEAKLIIVGEGKSGKTTLYKKLIQPNYQLENLDETHGINIHEGLKFVDDFRANLWDFGGQSLQYMTHQFFLTPRALYVLLMDTRAESPNLAYWFKIISLLGKEKDGEKISLLIVSNRREGGIGNINYQDVLKYYEDAFDYQYLEVDFSKNDSRWNCLKEAIEQRLLALPIVKNELPRQWKNIREDLREEAETHHHISTARLEEICTPRQVEGHEAQFQLTNYLHQLGSVLHFQNDPDLSDTIFLSPEWVVEGVYTVLKNEDIKANHGRFKAEDIFTILRSKGYKHDDATKILKLMSKHNFDICYQTAQGDYIAAQLLEAAKPKHYKWHPEVAKEVLQFRYQYPIMPKGLMSRLIVRLSEYIEVMEGEEIAWQKGAILHLKRDGQEARVMMVEDDAESPTGLREIIIEVMGDADNRKYALQRVRDEIHSLHQRWFKNIQFNEIVPCNCAKCQRSNAPESYALKDLMKLKQNSVQRQCLTGTMVSIQQLLEGVYDNKEIRALETAAKRQSEGERIHIDFKPNITVEVNPTFSQSTTVNNNVAELEALIQHLKAKGNDAKFKEYIETLPEPEDETEKTTMGKQIINWVKKNAEGFALNIAASNCWDAIKAHWHLFGS